MTYDDTDHVHDARESSHERKYAECVARDSCDPRSHGGATYTQTCACGAFRHINTNAGFKEIGGWYNPHEP